MNVYRISLTLSMLLPMVTGSVLAQPNGPDNARLVEFYQAQQYREAARYLEQFYPEDVADPAVLSRLGYCYRMAGDYKQAETYYLRLYAQDSLNVNTLLNLAMANAKRGLNQPAKTYYQQVIAVDSNHVGAYDALAGLMRRTGALDSAFQYLERANRLQPDNSDLAADFAQLCITLERFALADSVLQLALQTDADNGLLLFIKAKTADKLKNYLEVVRRCERLVELGEETQAVLVLLGKGYFHIDDFIGAYQTYTQALEKFTNIGEIDYYYLAMACKVLKKYPEGVDYMDKVLELAISPNAAIYYGRKADLQDLANRPSAAASSYLRSFQFSTIPIHYYSLAVLYDKKLTQPRNALRYYRLYLDQKPPKEEQVYVDYVQHRIAELAPLK